MTGKVTKYNPNTKTGYICNITNGLSCMFKESDVKGDDIANGYIVDFYLAYDEELQRKCAKGIRVIDSSVGIYSENKASKKKQKNSKHRKPCNADKVITDDKKFQRFVRKFMYEQKALKKEREKNNGNTYQ
ncbi:MAG: hypothetical protein II243_06325 [Lachnospiraceae bacterium]|nr:hypothetical protein [Lachnospiraceae bacterium]MBQ2407396.1 hypothetical protein [Lachnospiraceae bacterium]